MTNAQISAKFRKAYNGHKNFMTPDIIGFGEAGDYIYEISTGRGMSDMKMYGVSVLTAQARKPACQPFLTPWARHRALLMTLQTFPPNCFLSGPLRRASDEATKGENHE